MVYIIEEGKFKIIKPTKFSKAIITKIPKQWDLVPLESITYPITKGTTPTTDGEKFEKSGIIFLKVESFDDFGEINYEKCAYISQETYSKLKRSQLKENDILFTIAGTLGRVTRITKEFLPANVNQAISIIRLKSNEFDVEFLEYYLRSPAIKKQILMEGTILAQGNLSLAQMSNLLIAKPPKEEQIRISKTLSNIDLLIHNLKKSANNIDEFRQGLTQQIFSGQLEITE
jgi:type I restriction enzyme, S subunit